MVSSILPKNERWDNFQYIKFSQRSFFGRIEDTTICFRDCLTFKKTQAILREINELLRSMKQFFLDSHVHFLLLNYIQYFSMSRK